MLELSWMIEGTTGELGKEGEAKRAVESLPVAGRVQELPKEERRVEQLEGELLKERQRADEYYRRLQYLQADFENYRRRVEKEISEVRQIGNEALMEGLLQSLDELELAIKAGREAGDKETLVGGVEMIYRNLLSVLENHGLSQIKAAGGRFDPNLHEVAERVSDDKLTEGTIVEEVRKGFIFKGRVIRPSMVKVTVRPSASGISEGVRRLERVEE